jgi:hypothetical protein
MYVISFHAIFNENAILLSKRLNIPFVTEFNPQDGDVAIVFGIHEQADKMYFIQASKKIQYLIIQTEQFPSKVFDNKYYMDLIQQNPLLDWSRYNVERLKSKLELKIYSLYFYDFITHETPEWSSRPIDFFFCGASNPERSAMLETFKKENPTARIEIDLSYSFVNPVVLLEKLKQVKYVWNIPFYQDNALETHRINRALSAGCEVVSLYSKDSYLNKQYSPYVHFVKQLGDFTFLLENERKGDYSALMEDFGLKAIEANLRGILFAVKSLTKHTKVETEKETTDFMALLKEKKLKEMKKLTS